LANALAHAVGAERAVARGDAANEDRPTGARRAFV
jgi:hypothetical protein